jgi:D-glycero-D-manno-heptose 1,7-bisphosphate phosphatase
LAHPRTIVAMHKRAVFLDRDGVINELALNPKTNEYESPHALAEVHILPGAVDAARRLQDAGYVLFIVSNQPSYAKGKVTLETIHHVAAHIEGALRDGGVRIARACYCYHHPQGIVAGYSGPCRCRKPGTKLLTDARDDFGLDLSRSWMIGDQESDVACGNRAGCRTILVTNPLSAFRRPGVEKATLIATNLPDAVEKLLAHNGSGEAP